jgi:hypothetical protein
MPVEIRQTGRIEGLVFPYPVRELVLSQFFCFSQVAVNCNLAGKLSRYPVSQSFMRTTLLVFPSPDFDELPVGLPGRAKSIFTSLQQAHISII